MRMRIGIRIRTDLDHRSIHPSINYQSINQAINLSTHLSQVAVAVAMAAAAVIVLPVHGAGKTAAMAPAITQLRAMPTTRAAAVVAVDRPVAVAMTTPVTAELRADLSC